MLRIDNLFGKCRNVIYVCGMALKGETVKDYLEQYPELPDLTLAKLIYKENKIHFNSIENARSMVRNYRGHNGKDTRKKTKIKKYYKPVTGNKTPFKIPESNAKGLEIFKLSVDRKSLIGFGDIHFKQHQKKPLEAIIEYGIKNNIDTIFLMGDIMDMYQASDHEKNPTMYDIEDEFECTREFLRELRRIFPKAQIYYKEGNHEQRWERQLLRNHNLYGMDEFKLPILLKLEESKIHWIPNETLIKWGKLNALHGNEFRGGGGVNPARSLYLRAKDNCIAWDKHKSGEHTEGSLNGNIITTWSVGCVCDLNPAYLPMAHVTWNHGFAHVQLNGDDFNVRNMRIYNGKIL